MSDLATLQKVEVSTRVEPRDFLKFLGNKECDELLALAATLRGKRIVHVNATAEGGGVAQLLQSLIPYLRSLELESEWYAMQPNPDFFSATNALHNALQGAEITLSNEMWQQYEDTSALLAADIARIEADITVLHDPQLLLAGSSLRGSRIYYSHIDVSTPFVPVWNRLAPLMRSFDAFVCSNEEFVNESLPHEKVSVFTPAIDPLAPKQRIVSKNDARAYIATRGIPERAPLVAQISRFDMWKNPFGVLEAFQIVQKKYPDTHLALVGFNDAKDNPAAVSVYKDVQKRATSVSNVSLFFDPRGIDVTEFTVMVQNGADVIVQNSIREGFGLTVAEAMWKGQPVVGGPASGIRAQIQEGKNGFIADTSEILAEKILFLLEHPEEKRRLGEAARKTVQEKFLFPRYVSDHLRLYQSLGR